MLFVELDQVPERHNQAECRAHRYTQKRAVNIRYMIADNTIDAVIANMLHDKQIVLNKITGDKNTISFDLFKIKRGDNDNI
jgi:SNF2 family DNA or RNA helicase